MNKSSKFGGFVAIAIMILTVISTGCGSKSGKRQPSTATTETKIGGREFIHFHLVGKDTIWTGEVTGWKVTVDNMSEKLEASFDGDGDGLSFKVSGKADDAYSLLGGRYDSVGIKRDTATGKFILYDFYRGDKYTVGEEVYFKPDAMDVSFSEDGEVVYASVTTYVGDFKTVSIPSPAAEDIALTVLNAQSRPMITAKYVKNEFGSGEFEFVSITTSTPYK